MTKLIALLCLVGLFSCSVFKNEIQVEKEEIKKQVSKQIDNIPDWYIKPPKDKDALYEKAVSKSRDLQMAVNKATMLAKAQMALAIQGEINSIMKLYKDEVGGDNAQVSNNVSISTTQEAITMRMNGIQEERSYILQDGDKYVAYVLLKYPLGEMNRFIVEQIRQEDAANSKVRAEAAYDEIENKIKERRQSK